MSEEVHHSRHKGIMKLIRQLVELDKLSSQAQKVVDVPSPLLRRGSAVTASSIVSTTSSEIGTGEVENPRRNERKKTRKSIISKRRVSDDVFPQEDIDFISEVIHLKVLHSKGAWEGT
jgi:hypothetical protein